MKEEEKVSKRQLILVGIAVLLTGILLIVKTSHSVFQVNKTINIMDAKVGDFSNKPILMVAFAGNQDIWFEDGPFFSRDQVKTLTFTNTNEVPLDADGWFDVSEAEDGSVMMWWKNAPYVSGLQLCDVWIGGIGGVKANPDSSWLFYHLVSLQSIDLTYLDVSSVTNMSKMFSEMGNEIASYVLDLSTWNTSKVTTMAYMFDGAFSGSENITLNLSNWDISSLIYAYDINQMFDHLGQYSTNFTLNLSGWDVNGQSFDGMFQVVALNATNFTLDLSSWNVLQITDMHSFFGGTGGTNMYDCGENLTIDLSDWDISNVTIMDEMFMNIPSLTTLRLNNWDVPTASKFQMFDLSNNNPYPDNLKIYVKDAAMETWLKDYSVTYLPANAEIIY